MKRVLKWPIPLDDEWHDVPALRDGAWHVGWQATLDGESVTLWAETDLGNETETTRVRVFGTGHPYANTCRYLGTAFDPRGFVWHLIEAERSRD